MFVHKSSAFQMWLHKASVAAFFFQLFGYILLSLSFEHAFYGKRRNEIKKWKIQEAKRPERHPKHTLFASVNLVISAFFACTTTEMILRNVMRVSSAPIGNSSFVQMSLGLFKALVLQQTFEYGWHLLMHQRFFYRKMHKYHHFYTAPVVFCDLMIHPLEAFGYYVILYFSPSFLIQSLPKESFLLYVLILGVFGVFDHSGIDIKLPWWLFSYESAFHDLHHERFNVNFGFPLVFMDILFGTFEKKKGVFMERKKVKF